MTNFTFATTASGDTVKIATYESGVYITSFTVDTEDAAALAASIQSALEDANNSTAAQPFEVGQRVYYDGSDESVFAPAGEGMVMYVEPGGPTTVQFERETGDTYMQLVGNSALTPVSETDPREGMLKALRDSMNGQKVIIKDEPFAFFSAEVIESTGEETDEVFLDAGTEATVMSWEDYNSDDVLGAEGYYDEDRNFPVKAENGMVQVVALDACEPTSRDAVKAAAKRVGAAWADRLGIRPGVEVLLPPTSLAALIFGQGTVVSVTDGEATVNIADTAEETYLVTSLVPVP